MVIQLENEELLPLLTFNYSIESISNKLMGRVWCLAPLSLFSVYKYRILKLYLLGKINKQWEDRQSMGIKTWQSFHCLVT
jgi:hypothetical protein